MTNSHHALQEILQDTKAFFAQFSPWDCFAVSDLSLFPKEKTVRQPEQPPSLPPIPAKPRPVFQVPPKEEKKAVKETPKEVSKETPAPLIPLKQEVIQPLTSIGDTVLRVAPHFKILWDIPSDKKAIDIKNRWQVKPSSITVVLLSSEKNKDALLLLHNIAKAIEKQFAPTQLISLEKVSRFELLEGAKVVIAAEKDILDSNLVTHYRKIPSSSENYLGNIPLILIKNASYYLANPSEKRPLWNELCQKITGHLSQQS